MKDNYLPVSDNNPFTDNLLGMTSELINQPYGSMNAPLLDLVHEELKGGAKSKKTKKPQSKKVKSGKKVKSDKKDKKVKSDKKKVKKEKKIPSEKKRVKEIDSYLKPKLEKIAKKHDVNLKARDGKPKTKEQLFRSLKRKNLI